MQRLQNIYNNNKHLLRLIIKVKEIHDDVNQMRLVRSQINELIELLTDTVTYKPVIESGKKLVKKKSFTK